MNILLKTNSLKATPQRLAILKILDEFGHLNIDEIYMKVVEIYPSISLATIYKNINFLKEEGILLELPLKDMKPKYEIIKSQHSHFICNNCKKVIDIELEDNYSIVHNEIGKIESKELFLYGICKECKDKV